MFFIEKNQSAQSVKVQCGSHAVLWSHIDILMRLLAAEPRSTARLLFPVSLWNDPDDPVFDGVGLAGFMSRAITLLLAKLSYSLPFLFFLSVGCHRELESSDYLSVNRSLPALHCRPF